VKTIRQLEVEAVALLAQELRSVVEDVEIRRWDLGIPDLFVFWNDEYVGSVSSQGYEHFRRFLSLLFEQYPFDTLISQEFVRSKVMGLALNKNDLLQNERMLNDAIRRLEQSALASISDWVVYIPIDGVTCKLNKPVNFGKADLLQVTDEMYDLFENLVDETYRTATGKDPSKAHWKLSGAFRAPGSLPTRSIRNSAVLRIPVKCEKGRAPGLVVPEAERALHVLTYLALARDKLRARPRLAFRKESGYNVRCGVISVDGNTGYWQDESRRDKHETLVIDDHFLSEAETIGLGALQRICAGHDTTPLDNITVNALRWLHMSTAEASQENEFTNLMMVLETFLNPDGDEKIANAVAESTALLLGKDYDAKLEIKNQVKDLYRIRSKITHGVSVNQKQLATVVLLRFYAIRLIRRVLRKSGEWNNAKDIRKYIETLKLS
jgi:hypothetical protein